MVQSVAKQLIEQSIRLRRTDWRQNPNLGFDEIFLILSSLVGDDTGPLNITDPNGGIIQLPPLGDLNLPPFDFNFPEIPTIKITDSQKHDNTTEIVEKEFIWSRTVVPGIVRLATEVSGLFDVLVNPTGSLVTKSEGSFTFNPPTTPYQKRILVRQLDGSKVPDGTHVLVLSITELLVEKHTIRRDEDNSIVELWTEVSPLQTDNVMQAEVSAGGRVAKVESGGLSPMSGTTPGSGLALFYTFDGASLIPEPSSDENPNPRLIFNMVGSQIKADKFIQVKQISGYWFIDVEDCS